MAFIDYYKILGIQKNATESEIKKAYRKLARTYHPDLHPNDKDAERKFTEINEANEVLSDPENRKKYDTYGKDWKHADAFESQKRNQRTQAGGQSQNAGGFSSADYSDFFESMFSGRRESRASQGRDLETELKLKLTDVYTSEKKTLTLNGKQIRLTIPAGTKDGQVIKIKGKGGIGTNGGPNGDLLIHFVIENDTPFSRDGDHLSTTVDLDLYTALLGGAITVPTFDGKVKLTVKPETQNGTKVKLKGKGFPKYKKEGEFGDLVITYKLILPTRLNEKEKSLFEQLRILRANQETR